MINQANSLHTTRVNDSLSFIEFYRVRKYPYHSFHILIAIESLWNRIQGVQPIIIVVCYSIISTHHQLTHYVKSIMNYLIYLHKIHSKNAHWLIKNHSILIINQVNTLYMRKYWLYFCLSTYVYTLVDGTKHSFRDFKSYFV